VESNVPELASPVVLASARYSLRHSRRATIHSVVRINIVKHERLLYTLSWSRTAAEIHLTLASSAITSTAHCADAFDSELALEQSCSPCCKAFLDCNTRETRCG
jgi:hypothetical protein